MPLKLLDMTQSKEIQWLPLGNFIEQTDTRNTQNTLSESSVRGISVDKVFTLTKANLDGVSLSGYKVVHPNEFAYVPDTSRRGDKISLAYNLDEKDILISSIYTSFCVKSDCGLLDLYLYLWFCREEFNRFSRFHSWGSARETLSWSTFCAIKIPVPFKDGKPDIERQQEVVNIWDGLRKLRDDNLAIAEPLLQLCKAKVEELKHSTPMVELGNYIKVKEKLNSDNLDLPVKGLNKDKVFMPTAANMDGIKLSKYLVVENGMFAFSGMQTGRDVCIRIALNESSEQFLISPAYTTFIIDSDEFIPSFIYIWFMRAECDRLGWFLSDSSVRSNLDWNRFLSIKVPKPTVEVQQAIVDIYKCAKRAKDIAADADNQLKTICPALLQYVIHN
jgi:type I restriction enzyme S subunit